MKRGGSAERNRRVGEANRERIYSYIQQAIHETGWAPSIIEICAATGLESTSTVHRHLVELERDGLITRGKGARMISLGRAA